MKQEDKELLLKDLCARLPYDVKMEYDGKVYSIFSRPFKSVICLTNGAGQVSTSLSKCKPYLRPMSSMTGEEKKEYEGAYDVDLYNYHQLAKPQDRKIIPMYNYIDWLNSHHFDYRGLIEKGLALEAPEGMYDGIY